MGKICSKIAFAAIVIYLLNPALLSAQDDAWYIEYRQDSIFIFNQQMPLLPFGLTEVSAINEGKFWGSTGGKYAYFDTSGLQLTDTMFDAVFGFKNNMAVVGIDSLFGVINARGEMVAPAYYTKILSCRNFYLPALKDGYWGLLDTAGNESIEPMADAPPVLMENGCWALKYKGNWGVLNADFKIIVPFKYDCILPDGSAYKDGKKEIIVIK